MPDQKEISGSDIVAAGNNPFIVFVIIPAFNEAESISKVISDIPRDQVKQVVVVNNASTDNTSENAKKSGAVVVDQPLRGYGNACLAGIEWIKNLPVNHQPDCIVFLDGDYSDYPAEISLLLAPIQQQNCDLVIGSRVLGKREKGSQNLVSP